MLNLIRKISRSQDFSPGILGIILNPFYIARSELAHGIKSYSAYMNGRLLDIGCGIKPYENYFSVDSYVGLEIDSVQSRLIAQADKYYSGINFPFEDNSFECAICNQVLEHVFNPDQFLLEINRVLSHEGVLLLTVPFIWDEHEQPYDYARYTSFGLSHLAQKNGFRVIHQKKLGGNTSAIFQLINAYLFKVTLKQPIILKCIIKGLLIPLINIIGVLSKFIFPSNPDFYLDNIILLIKKNESLQK